MFGNVYKNKTVLVTGHTGFKGAWLCEWLLLMGAKVVGYSLEPPSTPSLYEQLGLKPRLAHDEYADVRDLEQLERVIRQWHPDFVFHLAAQTLVGAGYQDPLYTYQTNVMGTVHVLEALRRAQHACIAILITTDKVYENGEWDYAYRESDPIGGYDPYSASKGCCELVAASYRRSFFHVDTADSNPAFVAIATCRAGNVIGGGDWATDRIVPDCVRSLRRGEAIPVRNKVATRPWQHVLEPLSGYLTLGAELARAMQLQVPRKRERLQSLCGAFNFGPTVASNKTVADLVQEILKHWPGTWVDRSDPHAPHEAGKLNLASDKAFHTLGWRPQWDFEKTVKFTMDWYRAIDEINDMSNDMVRKSTVEHIDRYVQLLM